MTDCNVPNNEPVCSVPYKRGANISRDLYLTLTEAFACFNDALFESRLPQVIVTVHRHRGANGYFRAKAFRERIADGGGAGSKPRTVDEIAICPEAMVGRSDRAILSTLVHEMCHLWQEHFGRPSRSGYHNREWADKMDEVGLVPSSDGTPDGRRTGQRMTHYIQDGGAFAEVCDEMLSGGIRLEWDSPDQLKPKRPKSKFKYACQCGVSAWAKRDIRLLCGECKKELQMEDDDED